MRASLLAVVPAVLLLLGVRYAQVLRGWVLSPRTPARLAAGLTRGLPLVALVVLVASGLPGQAYAQVIVATAAVAA